MMREWIIFALCLGVGGHVALGFILHAPDLWPWDRAALYGLVSGLAVYALVQGGLVIRRMLTSSRQSEPQPPSGPLW